MDGGYFIDFNNLWLEFYNVIYKGVQMGAREKDKFELQVHKDICSGAITLQQGQDKLRNWWKYYKVNNSIGVSIIDEDDN